MIKYILYLLIASVSTVVSAQVGINTNNPVGVFHIHPDQNNPIVATDDVMVDANGNIGIGIGATTAAAKVHVAVPTGGKAFRMTDGSEAADRILMSDAHGNASWGVIKGSGGYAMRVTMAKTFPASKLTIMPLDGTNTRMNIVSAGNYLITIRWWGTTSAIGGGKTVSAYFSLWKNGSKVDGIEYYVPMPQANTPITFTTSLMATNCAIGDYLEIYIVPSIGGQPWTINGNGMVNPSIVVFRM